MAHELATILASFLPEHGPPPAQKVPDTYFVKKFNENETFKSEVLERIIERKLEGGGGEVTAVEGEEPDYGKNGEEPGKTAGGDDAGDGEAYPGEHDVGSGMSGFSEHLVLDTLYRHRTMKMDVTMPVVDHKEAFPLGHMSRQVMNEHDDPGSMDPLGIFFLPGSGDLMIYKRELPLTIEQVGPVMGTGFPDMVLVCDDSGSMAWNPWEGDGEYDAVLVLVYSLLEWLKDKGFAAAIEYNLVAFSSTTRTTGWVDYFHVGEMARLLFDKENGGTNLDPDVFNEVLDSPRQKVVIMITDGEIRNSKAIMATLREHRESVSFLFVQIGSMSNFGIELRGAGFPVLHVKDVSVLDSVVMAFVKEAYDVDR